MFHRIHTAWLPGMLLTLVTGGAWAQAAPQSPPPATMTLRQAFDAAWLRQPEAQSGEMLDAAARARRQRADSWTAEPPALELSGKTDQLDRDEGGREYELGIALPLWLPGERAAFGALADAELRAGASRTRAAQLRTAAAVRDAYWVWQRARADLALEHERLANARELAADVARRVRAGELARADQHQADGALATAEAALAEADSTLIAARQSLRGLTGIPVDALPDGNARPEPEPDAAAGAGSMESAHPLVSELLARTDVARRTVALVAAQGRANPELSIAATRERSVLGEKWADTVTVGLRIPLGSASLNTAKITGANAEAIEAEARLALERQRVLTEFDAARSRVEAIRLQLGAAERRAQLAVESQAFFKKAFILGEADLPTRLRIELEAREAERQLARTRIELAAAISALRQTMGLLPE